jgi:hypothetical protein
VVCHCDNPSWRDIYSSACMDAEHHHDTGAYVSLVFFQTYP